MQICNEQASGPGAGAARHAGKWLGIVAVTLSACGSGDHEFRIIETINSRDGSIVLEYAPGALASGPAGIRVRLEAGESSSVLYEGKISNDGAAVALHNIQPNAAKAGFLWLCLNGVAQEDVAVRIELATGLVIEEARPCSD